MHKKITLIDFWLQVIFTFLILGSVIINNPSLLLVICLGSLQILSMIYHYAINKTPIIELRKIHLIGTIIILVIIAIVYVLAQAGFNNNDNYIIIILLFILLSSIIFSLMYLIATYHSYTDTRNK